MSDIILYMDIVLFLDNDFMMASQKVGRFVDSFNPSFRRTPATGVNEVCISPSHSCESLTIYRFLTPKTSDSETTLNPYIS